jgi:hypothetical protein
MSFFPHIQLFEIFHRSLLSLARSSQLEARS